MINIISCDEPTALLSSYLFKPTNAKMNRELNRILRKEGDLLSRLVSLLNKCDENVREELFFRQNVLQVLTMYSRKSLLDEGLNVSKESWTNIRRLMTQQLEFIRPTKPGRPRIPDEVKKIDQGACHVR